MKQVVHFLILMSCFSFCRAIEAAEPPVHSKAAVIADYRRHLRFMSEHPLYSAHAHTETNVPPVPERNVLERLQNHRSQFISLNFMPSFQSVSIHGNQASCNVRERMIMVVRDKKTRQQMSYTAVGLYGVHMTLEQGYSPAGKLTGPPEWGIDDVVTLWSRPMMHKKIKDMK